MQVSYYSSGSYLLQTARSLSDERRVKMCGPRDVEKSKGGRGESRDPPQSTGGHRVPQNNAIKTCLDKVQKNINKYDRLQIIAIYCLL